MLCPGPVDLAVVDNTWTARSAVSTLALTHPQIVRSVRVYEDVDDIDLTEPPPHVLLLDYWLARDDRACLPHLPALKEWGTRILLFTSEERPLHLRRALVVLDLGDVALEVIAHVVRVDGLCLKNDGPAALLDAIVTVGRGLPVFSSPLARAVATDDRARAQLTAREIDVLEGLAHGLTVDEIAVRLVVSPTTVKTHVQHIHDKYRSVFGDRVNRGRLVHEAHLDGYLDRHAGPEADQERPAPRRN